MLWYGIYVCPHTGSIHPLSTLARNRYRDIGSDYLFTTSESKSMARGVNTALSIYKLRDGLGDSNAGSHLVQRITIALQSGNAASKSPNSVLDCKLLLYIYVYKCSQISFILFFLLYIFFSSHCLTKALYVPRRERELLDSRNTRPPWRSVL